MKNIDYNYWTDGYGKNDADFHNPYLAIAMGELYGRKGFDFGRGKGIFSDKDEKNHCRPDGYSSYTFANSYAKRMPFREKAVENNKELADRCYFLAGTIAGELFFPAHGFGKQSINQARGCNGAVNDMVYLTLDSIRKYYEGKKEYYHLKDAIERYGYFFDRFESFDGYIEYNLLQDYELLPKKFPTSEAELVEFWKRSVEFMESRAQRIEEYAKQNNLFDSE